MLTGGPYDLRRTVVSVRSTRLAVPGRPRRRRAGLYLDGKPIADVGLPPMPAYYRHTLANGKSVMEVAPTIQWGYLIYLTVFRVCQYFGAKEECQYCDINHNWRQHKAAGRPYTGVKPVDEVLEALEIIDRYDTDQRLAGLHADRRQRSPRRSTGWLRPTSTASTRRRSRNVSRAGGSARWSPRRCPAPTCSGSRTTACDLPPQLRGVGQAAVRALLPGQGALRRPRRVAPPHPGLGRDLRARNVIPNFVAGVEMAEPVRLHEVDEAIDSTAEGLDTSCRAASRRASPPGARSRRRR